MRLTFLIATLERSGAEKQLTLLACGLKERTDWAVAVVTLTRGGPYERVLADSGVPVSHLGKRRKFDLSAILRLRTLLKRQPPDVLHSWMFTSNAYARLAAGRKPPFRVVVSERCVDVWKSKWQLALDRRLAKRTDRLLANSQAVADFYREQGVPESMISVIPNAVELFQESDQLRSALRKEWQIPAGSRVVGYLGRLSPQKRVKDLLLGFDMLRELTPDVFLVLAGDGPERPTLEAQASQMESANQIRFVGHRPEGPRVMQAFDLFWLASDFEGMSNSIMEAMAAGLPCLASDIPPNRELVLPGETGVLTAVGDFRTLARRSYELLKDPEQLGRMAQAARNRMRNEFSVDAMIERHRLFYQELLASRRRGN